MAQGLEPTTHEPVPVSLDDAWWVPNERWADQDTPSQIAGVSSLGEAARLANADEFEAALALVETPAFAGTSLEPYAHYVAGLALLGADRLSDAEAILGGIGAQGWLAEAIVAARAEMVLRAGNPIGAVALLEPLTRTARLDRQSVWLSLGEAAEEAGEMAQAIAAFTELFYGYPTSDEALLAEEAIARLQPDGIVVDRMRMRTRADLLFDAGQFAEALDAYELVLATAPVGERLALELRIAESEYHSRAYRSAGNHLQPLVDADSPFRAEARYYAASVRRALNDPGGFVEAVDALVDESPESIWAQRALDTLASHFIIDDEDEDADRVFRQLYGLAPDGLFAERAVWKIGWRSYRLGRFDDAHAMFDEAATTFPRANTRPAWLYWSGRALAENGNRLAATERYRLAAIDYGGTYYGRLATRDLAALGVTVDIPDLPRTSTGGVEEPADSTRPLVEALLRAGLWEAALNELRYAEPREGTTPAFQATLAWAQRRQGRDRSGLDQLLALRGAINRMKRAYPQYLGAAGEQLPLPIQREIFPLSFGDLIIQHASDRQLDPAVMMALVAQESTFSPDVESSAGAVGLMQLLPGTAQRIAPAAGVGPFDLELLTDVEANIRMGMTYYRSLVDEFGQDYLALAAYNAGERAVRRWMDERPGLGQDEFIDDIPFPETQFYVKRILGTAEDYRRLYGAEWQ